MPLRHASNLYSIGNCHHPLTLIPVPHTMPQLPSNVSKSFSDSPSLSCPGAQGTEFNFNPIYILYTHTNTRLHVKWLITMFSLLFLHQLVYCFIFYSLFLLKLLSRLTPPQLLATCKLQPSCWRDLSLFSVKILDLFILFFPWSLFTSPRSEFVMNWQVLIVFGEV